MTHGTYEEMARRILIEKGYAEEGWSVLNEAVLICPHGHQIEFDGACFEGCRSPFLKEGLI